MKLPIIKQLATDYSVDELSRAEALLAEGHEPDIPVPGDDDGERLTHAMAASYVRERLDDGMPLPEALRAYTSRVRACLD